VGGPRATTSQALHVAIAAVDDAPELQGATPTQVVGHSGEAHPLAGGTVADADSAFIGGATIEIGHLQSGDHIGVVGLTLHQQEDGRVMIGETGIEWRMSEGAGTARVELHGAAGAATYTQVLQAVTLENAQATGLAPGARDIAVTLRDSEGVASAPMTSQLQVQAGPLVGDGHDGRLQGGSGDDVFVGSAGHEVMVGGAGADHFTVLAGQGGDTIEGGAGSWTDVLELKNAGEIGTDWTLSLDTPDAPRHTGADGITFDQPVSGHIEWADGSQVAFSEIEKIVF
jgi:Ca2+-binding RTX toxin-like protein